MRWTIPDPTSLTWVAQQHPFAAYLDALTQYAYPRPSKGLKGRLILLLCLIGIALLLSLVLFAVICVDTSRRPGARLWIMKMVKRDEGSYVITNVKLATPFAAMVMLSALVGYNLDCYNMSINNGTQHHIGGWRAGATTSFVFGGWIVTWSGLQAYLLSRPFGEGIGWRILRPLVVNILYVGGGAVLLIIMLVTTAFEAVSQANAFDAYEGVARQLATAAKDPTASSFDAIFPAILALNSSYIKVQKICAITFGVLTTSLWISAVINFGSLGLLFSVRNHIDFKLSELAGHVWTRQIGTINDEEDEDPPPAEAVVECKIEEQPSRSQIRKIAKNEPDSFRGGRAQQIFALQSAEIQLFVIAITMANLLLGGGAISCSITVLLARYTFYSTPWVGLEFGTRKLSSSHFYEAVPDDTAKTTAWFMGSWAISVFFIALLSTIIHNGIVSLPPRSSVAANSPSSGSWFSATSATLPSPNPSVTLKSSIGQKKKSFGQLETLDTERSVRVEISEQPFQGSQDSGESVFGRI